MKKIASCAVAAGLGLGLVAGVAGSASATPAQTAPRLHSMSVTIQNEVHNNLEWVDREGDRDNGYLAPHQSETFTGGYNYGYAVDVDLYRWLCPSKQIHLTEVAGTLQQSGTNAELEIAGKEHVFKDGETATIVGKKHNYKVKYNVNQAHQQAVFHVTVVDA